MNPSYYSGQNIYVMISIIINITISIDGVATSWVSIIISIISIIGINIIIILMSLLISLLLLF